MLSKNKSRVESIILKLSLKGMTEIMMTKDENSVCFFNMQVKDNVYIYMQDVFVNVYKQVMRYNVFSFTFNCFYFA